MTCVPHECGITVSIIFFVVFLILNSCAVKDFMCATVPDKFTRTICVGLLLSAVVFLLVGLTFQIFNPVVDERKQKIYPFLK